jgi:hypothetical protein
MNGDHRYIVNILWIKGRSCIHIILMMTSFSLRELFPLIDPILSSIVLGWSLEKCSSQPYQILIYIVFIQLFKKTGHIYYVIRYTTWSSVHPSPPILPCTWRMELKIVMNDHCKLLTKCCYFLDRLKIQDGHQRGT